MSELLCPKCSANQVIANKDGSRIKITCLVCGHEFRPGQGATSIEDFKNKNKLDKQARKGCAVLFLIAIIVLITIKLCTDYNDSKQARLDEFKSKAKSYDFMFEIDKEQLIKNPIKYLEEKELMLSASYNILNKRGTNINENTIFINELMKFDSIIIANLYGSLEGIGYLTFTLPEKDNPERQINVYIQNTTVNDLDRIIFYQEKFSYQYNGIFPNDSLFNTIVQLQHNKVKFKAELVPFNTIDSKIKETKKSSKVIDDESLLKLYQDFVKERAFRVEFISFQRISK